MASSAEFLFFIFLVYKFDHIIRDGNVLLQTYKSFSLCQHFPHLLFSVHPQFRHLEPVLSTGMKSAGESYKAERWLLHSLQVHMLSSQLRPLLKHLGHMRKYYNGEPR